MKKKFNLVIGEDVIPFFAIDVNDESETPDTVEQQKKLFAFQNNASIVDISHLNYRPEIGSEYSDELRDFPESSKDRVISLDSDVVVFAYLVQNVLYGVSYLRHGEEKMDMLIAAIQSNPTIVEVE